MRFFAATLALRALAYDDFCPQCKEQADAFCASECLPNMASACDGPMVATVEYRGGCSASAYCLSPFAMLPTNSSYEASTCQCREEGLEAIYASCGCQMPGPAPCPSPPPALEPALKEDVFVNSNSDNVWFRTPALVTTKSGRLLAFAEQTVLDSSHGHDLGPSPPSLVVRSSDDGGASWSQLRTAYNEAGHEITGATPVVDLESGDVHLLFTRDGREIHAVTSQDDGGNWSLPTDHTAALVGQLPLAGTGPGAGTQLPGGRLVAAARACCSGAPDIFDVFAVYSDDHGKTWHRGHTVGLGDTVSLREGQVAQLGDGELAMVLSAKPEKGSGQMAVAVSSDHGETWAIPARMAPSIALNHQYPVASLGGTDGGLLVADESYLYTLDSLGGTEPTWRYFIPSEHVGWSSVAYNSDGPMMLYESMVYKKISFVANFGQTSEVDMVV